MKLCTKILLCSVFLYWGVLNCFSQDFTVPLIQQQVSVETNPHAVLYELKNVASYTFPMSTRVSYDVSSLKQKKVKKPTQFEVVDITNIQKVPEYDAYVVKNKDKYYLVSSSDISDNSYLDRKNKSLMHLYQSLKDSVEHCSPSASFNELMSMVDSRIKTCTDSILFLRTNQETIFETKARNDALAYVEESLQKYKERRESYYNWVSTLPASVQKDAKILAIPESYIEGGYTSLCGYQMRILNMSNKTIKYLTWNGKVKNAVGDYISCEVRHTSSFSGKYTGPCNSLCDDFAAWDAVLFNASADEMVLTSVKVIYTDGSSVTIAKQSLDYITNIPRDVFFNNRYSFLGYDMGSIYEDGYDINIEIKDKLFLSRSRYERELREELTKQRELEQNYKDAKKILSENQFNSSILATYLGRGNVFRALSDDREFIRAVENYRITLDRGNKASKSLADFEKKYFGFLN